MREILRCAKKSNEITTIPAILKIINIGDCIVTIYAMGYRKEIIKEREFASGHQRFSGLGGAHKVQRD